MILGPSGPKSNSKGGRLMKNFRKVLALILVVATLFSFAAMIGAREVGDYTDYDKVSYKEAVDVLTAIGILDGYTDGSFKPTDSIAREEMAKMVAVLSNAGDDVSTLYASACKFADTKDRWSASYVAYCNETGIVAGRNATTFDPRGNVTGIETAKMLLCLIGFDATAQGYVGSNWKTRVMSDAKAVGLLDGFAADYDIAKAITREEAAQMMLNALQAPMVIGTLSDNIVTITNNVWILTVGDNWLEVGTDITLNDAEKSYNAYVLFGNVVVSNIPVWTNYRGLSVGTGLDCYGNPETVWSFDNAKGTRVWECTYPIAPDFTSSVAVDFEDVLEEEIDSFHDYHVTVYVDGAVRANWNHADLSANAAAGWVAGLDGLTGKGVQTNVYVDDVWHEVIITIKNTYIGLVTSVSNLQGTFRLSTPAYGTSNAFDNTDYGFEVGDVILYWICSNNTGVTVNPTTRTVTFTGVTNQLHDAMIAPSVTGLCTRTEVSTSAVRDTILENSKTTVDGKAYEYADNFNDAYNPNAAKPVMNADDVKASKDNDQNYILYLDEYGYVMAWGLHNPAAEVYYAYGVEDTGFAVRTGWNNQGGVYEYTNDVYKFDDASFEDDMKMDWRIWNAIDTMGDNTDWGKGLLFAYTLGDDGVAEWAGTADPAGVDAYLDVTGNVLDDHGIVAYGDNTTKYMVRTWDYAAGEYKYNVYTRDQLTDALEGYVYSSRGRQMATIQYFASVETNGADYLNYVFIDALYQRTAQKAMVYSKSKLTISDSIFVNQIRDYVTYDAVINGERAVLAVTHDLAIDGARVPWLYEAKLQVIGLLDGSIPVYSDMGTGMRAYDNTGARLQYVNGNFNVEATATVPGRSYIAAPDCVVVVADVATNTYTKLDTVEEINTYFEDTTGTNTGDNSYYAYTAFFMFNDGEELYQSDLQGTVDEVFIIVNGNVNNGNVGNVQ